MIEIADQYVVFRHGEDERHRPVGRQKGLLLLRTALVTLAFLMVSIAGRAEDICEAIDGASIVAEDGTFLGRVRNAYASDSLLNDYGRFGSEYSRTSIWNEYGRYGSEYSQQSPFNPYTSTPPMILKSDTIIGYLTVNKSIKGAVNPYVLKACEF